MNAADECNGSKQNSKPEENRLVDAWERKQKSLEMKPLK